jgi:WhiB family redox-sensing transcriptional regulator
MRPWSSLIPSDALWSWQLRAQCREEDPAIFFPVDGERGKSLRRRQQQAKAICAQCDVIRECLNHSIRHHERFGIWGGLAEHEREDLLGGDAADTPAGVARDLQPRFDRRQGPTARATQQ